MGPLSGRLVLTANLTPTRCGAPRHVKWSGGMWGWERSDAAQAEPLMDLFHRVRFSLHGQNFPERVQKYLMNFTRLGWELRCICTVKCV